MLGTSDDDNENEKTCLLANDRKQPLLAQTFLFLWDVGIVAARTVRREFLF